MDNPTREAFRDPSAPVDQRVEDLLGRMTLEEKIAQIGSVQILDLLEGQKFSDVQGGIHLRNGIGQITRLGGGSLLPPSEIARAANAIQDYLRQHTRLGIPAMIHEECCSGYMALGATCFPQIIGLSSTWMPELAEAMTGVIRTQMRAAGAHQGLAPVLDIARDARWGRVEETFGEDPYLASQMGMAYVRGLQGEDPTMGVMATAKHFVSHAISEGGLNCAPVQLGPRAMRDVFLMPFAAVIQEARVASVMNAYTEMDGVVVAASRRILTDLLRGELGFKGLVVSDYGAIHMLHSYHHVAKDLSEAATLSINAGIDVELPRLDCYGGPLQAALAEGQVSQQTLDQAVRRVLREKFVLGLFENPFVDEGAAVSLFDTAEQRELARHIALLSLVLLKNEGDLLPLQKDLRSLAVIGPNADRPRHLLGDYTHPPHIEVMIEGDPGLIDRLGYTTTALGLPPGSVSIPSILESIRQIVSPATEVNYALGCEVQGQDRSGFDQALQAVRSSDAAILVLGDKSGLGRDCTSGESRDRADLGLPGVQQELLEAVCAQGKPVVLVLVNGRPPAIVWAAEHISAILEAWLPGEEGGRAVAETLFGDFNPGGKLPISFPRSVGQVPVYYNHNASGARSHWHGDYVSTSTNPLYPFGHGLSYTRFTYRDLEITPSRAAGDGAVSVALTVANAGERAGDEVVQLYTRDEYASLPRPVKELKGFLRLRLEPGEARQVRFEFPVGLLAFYDEDMRLVVEPGTIQVMVGSSSTDIRLSGSFEIIGAGKHPLSRRVFTSHASAQSSA